jgi:hypothetical protein
VKCRSYPSTVTPLGAAAFNCSVNLVWSAIMSRANALTSLSLERVMASLLASISVDEELDAACTTALSTSPSGLATVDKRLRSGLKGWTSGVAVIWQVASSAVDCFHSLLRGWKNMTRTHKARQPPLHTVCQTHRVLVLLTRSI